MSFLTIIWNSFSSALSVCSREFIQSEWRREQFDWYVFYRLQASHFMHVSNGINRLCFVCIAIRSISLFPIPKVFAMLFIFISTGMEFDSCVVRNELNWLRMICHRNYSMLENPSTAMTWNQILNWMRLKDVSACWWKKKCLWYSGLEATVLPLLKVH